MADIPRAVLSEQFEALMEGRRVRAAVFVTYQFEPGFFEQQVLPVFLDVPLSHAESIRRVQLEEALRSVPGEIAVYYDARALVAGDGGSSRLDVRRIPIRHTTGVFHPKNVFLLVERAEADEHGQRPQFLVVTSLSANLTRAGWWENVECGHVETIPAGGTSRLRDELIAFLEALRARSKVTSEQRAVREMLAFLRQVQPRQHKSTDGRLHTHFYGGREPLPDFLERVAGERLQGAYLEVISPFFDDAATSAPLEVLIHRFRPREVRVFLPRSAAGTALVRPDLYEEVRALPDVVWGRLPNDVLRLTPKRDGGLRYVHAKLYRFFTQNPKRELSFVGSANLTNAAHQQGGNWESGFLVDRIPPRRPEFWLEPDAQRPREFEPRREDEPSTTMGGSRLSLTYHWGRSEALAHWDAPSASPTLLLSVRGERLGECGPLPAREWVALDADLAQRIGRALAETSLFEVCGDGPQPVPVLVQEEAMSHKPSLLLQLSVADILRYWSLLTPEQRSTFLELRSPELALTGDGADLVSRVRPAQLSESLFDRFAGTFHAFGCLEREVRAALEDGREKHADYRLFGQKHDSLGTLLARLIARDHVALEDVERYVILQCVRQLVNELARDFPDYWKRHEADAVRLQDALQALSGIRERLMATDPAQMPEFLDWFDGWFLRRAEPVEQTPW